MVIEQAEKSASFGTAVQPPMCMAYSRVKVHLIYCFLLDNDGGICFLLDSD